MPETYLARYENEETHLISFVCEYRFPFCFVLLFNAEGGQVGPPIYSRTFERACEIAQQLILP